MPTQRSPRAIGGAGPVVVWGAESYSLRDYNSQYPITNKYHLVSVNRYHPVSHSLGPMYPLTMIVAPTLVKDADKASDRLYSFVQFEWQGGSVFDSYSNLVTDDPDGLANFCSPPAIASLSTRYLSDLANSMYMVAYKRKVDWFEPYTVPCFYRLDWRDYNTGRSTKATTWRRLDWPKPPPIEGHGEMYAEFGSAPILLNHEGRLVWLARSDRDNTIGGALYYDDGHHPFSFIALSREGSARTTEDFKAVAFQGRVIIFFKDEKGVLKWTQSADDLSMWTVATTLPQEVFANAASVESLAVHLGKLYCSFLKANSKVVYTATYDGLNWGNLSSLPVDAPKHCLAVHSGDMIAIYPPGQKG